MVHETYSDTINNHDPTLVGYQFLFEVQMYYEKQFYYVRPGCADLEDGCSRIQINFNFKEKLLISNYQANIYAAVIAIGSTLTILKLAYSFTYLFFLKNHYRNFLGESVKEADLLLELKRLNKSYSVKGELRYESETHSFIDIKDQINIQQKHLHRAFSTNNSVVSEHHCKPKHKPPKCKCCKAL